MDKDLIRLKRRQSFVNRRKEAYKKVIKNYPDGLTKENLGKFKEDMKEQELKEPQNER